MCAIWSASFCSRSSSSATRSSSTATSRSSSASSGNLASPWSDCTCLRISSSRRANSSAFTSTSSSTARRSGAPVRLLHQENHSARLGRDAGAERRTRHPDLHRAAASVGRIERQVQELGLARQAGADGGPEPVHRQTDVQVEEILPHHFVGPEAPHVLGAPAPLPHLEVAIDDGHRAPERGQNGFEEPVQLAELFAPVAGLLVDGLELL